MTVVSSGRDATGTRPGPASGAEDAADPAASGSPKRRLSWRLLAYAGTLTVLVLAVPLLAYKGFQILYNEETGQVLDPVTDPAAPGFEALVTPTPTAMMVETDDAGALVGVTVLSLTDDGGGHVVHLPATTVLPLPLTEQGEYRINEMHQVAGDDILEQRVEILLGTAMGERLEIPAAQWASLTEPLGGVTVDNPTAVTTVDAAGVERTFPAGTVDLAPDDVAPFLYAKADGETEAVRINRVEAFWSAWLAELAERDDPALVPGETDQGLGRFVRQLAAGAHDQTTLPVEVIGVPGVPAASIDLYRPVQEQVDALVSEVIPFPAGEGRLRTRLVDGVGGEPARVRQAAQQLTGAGAELTVIGNAEEFGQERTVVVFFRPEQRPQAKALRDALGVGRLLREPEASSSVDAVVVLGADYPADSDSAPPADGPGSPTIPFAEGGIAPGAPGGDPVG